MAIGDCEVGKAVDCEDGGVTCALWLLVDEAIGVRRAIVAGYCRCGTMESVDGHDEKADPWSWSNGEAQESGQCQDLIHPMYSGSLYIVLTCLSFTPLGPDHRPLVRVRQLSDLPLRVCFHLVEHRSLTLCL